MTMDKQLASHHANAPSPTAKVFSAAFYGLSSLGTYVEHASACFGGGGDVPSVLTILPTD